MLNVAAAAMHRKASLDVISSNTMNMNMWDVASPGQDKHQN